MLTPFFFSLPCHFFHTPPSLPYLFFFFFFFLSLVFPDLSVLSTLLLGQIRLSCIPDIPAAYVRNSIQLLWARSLSFFSIPLSLRPSPLYQLIHIWSAPYKGGRGFTLTSTLAFFLFFFLVCVFHFIFAPHTTSFPRLLFPSILTLSERGSQRRSHMTASVRGLETGFYT